MGGVLVSPSAGSLVPALLALGVVGVAALNLSVPVLSNPRWALALFLALGMAMCTRAMALEQYGWGNPWNVAGMMLGALMLAVGAAGLFGWALPFAPDARAALYIVAALALVKMLVALGRHLPA